MRSLQILCPIAASLQVEWEYCKIEIYRVISYCRSYIVKINSSEFWASDAKKSRAYNILFSRETLRTLRVKKTGKYS